jgi:glycosyltransferase involved in cell wall biosynthesis
LSTLYRHIIVAADGRTDAAQGFASSVAVSIDHVPLAKGRGVALGNLRRVRALLRRVRPDLMLTYNFGAIEAALSNRFWPLCPHLHFEDGFGPEEVDGRQLSRRVWLRRLALSGRTKIVVPSRTLHALAVDGWGFSPDRVLHIPNGVDCGRYERASDARTLALRRSPDEVVIGTVGMLRPEKNLPRLIRAFAKLESATPSRLVIVGEGPERWRLEALAAELGVAERVTLTGFLPEPELAFREFDIYALSSDTEQMPLGMVEAMAAGLPVVATKVGDVPYLLPEMQQPFVVAKAEESLFASQLELLLDDRQQRLRMGARNRQHASTSYAIDQTVRRYELLFAELTSTRPRPQPRFGRASA